MPNALARTAVETDELDPITQLNIKSQLADAKLGVAEHLGWPLSGFAAATSYLAFGSWLLTIAVLIGMYYLVTLKYRRDSAVSEDKYYQAAGLGKYYSAKQSGGNS
jgi:hypothetical protein